MKSISALLISVLLLFTAHMLVAADLTVEWDDPDNPEGSIAKYEVEIKVGTGAFGVAGQAVAKELDIKGLVPGTYTLQVSALTADGFRSPPSEPLTFTIPNRPGKVRVKVALQTSGNMREWKTLISYEVPDDANRGFYRAAFVQ